MNPPLGCRGTRSNGSFNTVINLRTQHQVKGKVLSKTLDNWRKDRRTPRHQVFVVDAARPSLGVGNGLQRVLRCIQQPVEGAIDESIEGALLPEYHSDRDDSSDNSSDNSSADAAEYDGGDPSEDHDANHGDGDSDLGDEASDDDGSDSDLGVISTGPYDKESLPDRKTTGARLQQFNDHWQGWYAKCPKTGKPTGDGADRCQCAGGWHRRSKVFGFGPGTEYTKRQARDLAMQWIRDQHPVHTP